MDAVCESCEFYAAIAENAGQCRAHPPNAALVPTQGIGGPQLQVTSYWPQVQNDFFCGEFMAVERAISVPLSEH